MKRILSFFVAVLAMMAALTSCEPTKPIDVILTDYQYSFVLEDVHLADGLPAVCEVMLDKGGKDEESVSVEYRIDDSESLRLIVGGQMFNSGSKIKFDSLKKVKMTLPDLPEGPHTLHLVLTNQYGKKFSVELAFRVIRDKVLAKGIEAPMLLRMEAGIPVDTVLYVTPADADVTDVAYLCSNPDIVLVGLSGSGPKKRLHLDPQREGYANIDLYHEDMGEDPVATIKCEVFSYRLSGLPAEMEIQNGGTKTIQLSVRPVTEIDLWVSGTSVTASPAGSNQWVLQARGEGESIVTVTAGNSVATCLVNVGRVPESIYISPMSATIEYGKTREFQISSSAGYTCELEGEGATILERSARSVTIRNDNDGFDDKRVKLHVYNEYDPLKSATAEILLSRRPETISLTEMTTGVGSSVWLVGGENRGWQLIRRPSGVESSVDGNIITFTNKTYKSVSGTILVRTNEHSTEASSSVMVPGLDVVLKDMEAIPSSFNEEVGRSVSVALEATYTDGTVTDVTNSATWTQSSNMSRNGNSFTTLAPGEAWIRASYGGRSIRIEGVVTPQPVSVRSVTLDPGSFTALVGENKIFTARAKFSDGSELDVTRDCQWAVTGPASEIGKGYYRITGAGEILVEARYLRNGSTMTGTSRGVSSKPEAQVTGVSIDPVRDSVQVGAAVSFTGTVYYNDGSQAHNGQFSVTPEDVLVGANGVYNAIKTGTVAVTYSYGGWSASAVVVVTPEPVGPDPNVPAGKTVSSFSVRPSTMTIDQGDTKSLVGDAVYTDGTTETVRRATWTSTDEGVAMVDEMGNVFGMSLGTAIVTGIYGGKSSMCLVTVAKPVVVNGLSVSPATLDLTVDHGTGSVSAVASYSDGSTKDVTGTCQWTSNDGSIASVSGGVVTPLKGGSTSVVASFSGYSASCQVKVTKLDQSVDRISLNRTSMTLTEGQTFQLDGTVYCINPTKEYSVRSVCTFESSDDGVASVSSRGIITAVKAGKATITVRNVAPGNNTATCQVTVVGKAPEKAGLLLEPASGNVTAGGKFNLSGSVQVYYLMSDGSRGSQVSSAQVRWTNKTDTNNRYASLADGVVTVNAGTPTMSLYYVAAAEGLAGYFQLNVTEKPDEPYLNPSTGSVTWEWDNTSSKDITFESNTSWSAKVTGDFEITSATSGKNSGKVSVRPSGKNTGTSDKTGVLTLSYSGTSATVALKQTTPGTQTRDKFSLEMKPNTFDIGCNGYVVFKAEYYKTIETSTDGGKTWTAGQKTLDSDVTTKASWTVTEGGTYAAFGSTKGRLDGKNETFTDQTVRVKAEYSGCEAEATGTVRANAPFVNVDPGSVTFGAKAKSESEKHEVTVVSNTSWSAVGDENFNVSPANGKSGTTTLTISARNDNYSTGTITGKVTLTYYDNNNAQKNTFVSVSQSNVTNTRLYVTVPASTIAADGSVQAKAIKQESISQSQWKDVADVTSGAKWSITEGQHFAKISNQGLVTGTNATAKDGSVEIWASYGDLGESEKVTVYVQAKVAQLDFSASSSLVWAWNETAQKQVTIRSNVAWKVSSVPDGFAVEPMSGPSGETVIRINATSQNESGASGDVVIDDTEGFGKTIKIFVEQEMRGIRSISVTPPDVSLGVGQSQTLSYECLDSNGNSFNPSGSVQWMTDDSKGVIDASSLTKGIIQAVNGGTCNVWAELYGKTSNKVPVTVNVLVEGITLSSQSLVMDSYYSGKSVSATVTPSGASNTNLNVLGVVTDFLSVQKLNSNGNIHTYEIRLSNSSTVGGSADLLFMSESNPEVYQMLSVKGQRCSLNGCINGEKIISIGSGTSVYLSSYINLSLKGVYYAPGPGAGFFEHEYEVDNVLEIDGGFYWLGAEIHYESNNPSVANVKYVNDKWLVTAGVPGLAVIRIYKEDEDTLHAGLLESYGYRHPQVEFGCVYVFVK